MFGFRKTPKTATKMTPTPASSTATAPQAKDSTDVTQLHVRARSAVVEARRFVLTQTARRTPLRDQMLERLDPAIEAEFLHNAAEREEAQRRRDEKIIAAHAEAARHGAMAHALAQEIAQVFDLVRLTSPDLLVLCPHEDPDTPVIHPAKRRLTILVPGVRTRRAPTARYRETGETAPGAAYLGVDVEGRIHHFHVPTAGPEGGPPYDYSSTYWQSPYREDGTLRPAFTDLQKAHRDIDARSLAGGLQRLYDQLLDAAATPSTTAATSA